MIVDPGGLNRTPGIRLRSELILLKHGVLRGFAPFSQTILSQKISFQEQ
jgi:hypothetical protein